MYSDDYADSIGSYLARTEQTDEGGRLSTNTESAGRFHSNWLNMMYPRLKLAKNLLRDDGVIFISIDDNEHANLRVLCDEVFGEHNYLNTFTWVSNPKGRQISSSGAAITKEHILCFGRRKNDSPEFTIRIDLAKSLMPSSYKGFDYELMSDAYGHFVVKNELYNSNSKFNEETRPTLVFDLYYNPKTGEVRTEDTSQQHIHPEFVKIPPKTNNDGIHRFHANRWSREKVAKEGHDLYFKEVSNGEWRVYTKVRSVKETFLKDTITGLSTTTGSTDIEKVGISKAYFDHPKPIKLIQVLLEAVGTGNDDFILDFFAGSGTTAQAVMQTNAEDGGNRRCISVQLPEPTGEKSEARKAGFKTISEITRERIRRAGENILAEESGKLDGRAGSLDVGFRAYKLVDTNFTKWKADSGLSEEDLVGLLAQLADSADAHTRDEALLTEVLLKLGFSLTEKIETVEVEGLRVFSVADGLVLAYLDEHRQPTLDQLRALVAEEPERLVVLEDAFQGSDELKTNLVQECRTRNVDLWTA
ncbi:site-specific DNA-methyltransferase [Actinotignum schaalii]|uniref:site-specific DNA-methyltransferase n=1 Tax=Actinotignum schaalii TaxID=59505 RepID=UPI00373E5BD1